MKITVIIPNFNDLRVNRALNSIDVQTYKNYEIIVSHGGEINNEFENIYSSYSNLILLHEEDKGIFDALNKGLRRSKGSIIYLMGSDDFISDKNVFKKVIQSFKNEDLDGVCIGCKFVNNKNKIIREWNTYNISSQKILMGILPPHFSLFLKKDIYDIVGDFKFKLTRNIATDSIWLIDLAILKPSVIIKSLNDCWLNMEYGGSSTGSVKNIFIQYFLILQYCFKNRKHVKYWYFVSFVKTFSKLFQFKFRL